jgi:iron complex outermembrane receptor protein
MLRSALLATSLIALSVSQAAMAQDAANTAGADGDVVGENPRPDRPDIIVTGTRIATNVQDVPIAITAVTAEALEAQQITTFADLGNIVPNATFRKSQGVYGAGVSVTLRGLGTTNTQFSSEPAVAYYIDDVYYPFLFGSNFDLLDLERIEVLRGPQGTLFGRNAISGAVNLVSRTPSFTETSGYADFTVGSFERLELRAGINLPLTDNLAVSVSGSAKRREGYMDLLDFSCEMYRQGTPELAGTFPFQSSDTNWIGGRTPDDCKIDAYGGEDVKAARGALRWEPAPGVEVNLSGDYSYANNDSAAEKVFEVDYQLTYGRLRGTDENGNRWGAYTGVIDETDPRVNQNFITAFDQFSIPGTPFRYDERFETGDIYTTYDNFCDPFPVGTQIEGNAYYNGSLFRGGNCYGRKVPVENWGVTGKVSVDITDNITALGILGHRQIYTFFGAGWDGTPLADSIIYHEDKMEYTSGELRLTGQWDWLDFVAGLFYYDGYAAENGQPQNVRTGTQQYHDVFYYPEAKAAYLNVTFKPYELLGFAEGLSINGGLRRSDDEKLVDYSAQFDASEPGSTTFIPGANSTFFELPIANKRWDWKLGVDYEVTPEIMVYASAATGYRLPGFQTRIFQAGQIQQEFPTALISYEAGFKVDLFDRRLRLNGTAFYMDYSMRNGTFGGAEPRYDPNSTDLVILPGSETLIPDGPDDTEYSDDFTNCRPYVESDGAPNGSTVGITCITRSWNYPVSGGDPIKGVELEATAEPIDNLLINYNFGYTDRGSTTGRPIGFPDYTMNGGVQYTAEVPELDGTITPRLDWFWISKVAWSTDYEQFDDPARSTFNARITYVNEEDDYEVAVGVTNLTDEKYYRQKIIFIQGLGAGANIGQPANPREWYLSIAKRF